MTSHRKINFVIIFMLFVGLIAGCANNKRKVLAQVGSNGVITLEELRKSLPRTKQNNQQQKYDLETLKKHLDEIIDQKVMKEEAYKLGLDQDSSVINIIKPYKEDILLQRLYEKEILEPIVKESDIREYYAKMGKDVIIRKILFKIPSESKPDDEQKVKEKATDILRQIRAGENFSKLAQKYSEDEKTASKGGLVGAILWIRNDDPIQQTAFSMKAGAVSGLVKNNQGYNIIKVDSIRVKKREPLENVKKQIQDQLYSERQMLIRERAKTYLDQLMIKMQVVWYDTALNRFVDWYNRIYTKNLIGDYKTDFAVLKDSLLAFSRREKESVLETYKGGRITVKDLIDKLTSSQEREFPWQLLKNKERLKSYVGAIWQSVFLIEVAKQKGLEKDNSVENKLKTSLERAMVHRLIEKEVMQRIVAPTDEELRNYYDVNKQSKYSKPDMVKVQEVFVDNLKLADKIYRSAISGNNFSTLVRQYTTRPGYKEKNGIIDYFPRGRWGSIGRQAFTMKVGEISKPIKEGNRYSVIKLLDKKISLFEPYEEAKQKVIRDLQKDKEAEQKSLWLAEERKKIGVKIYEDALEHSIDQM